MVVIGGGPVGSFFAIRALKRARELGRTLDLTILEKKSEVCLFQPVAFYSWEGCNHCAGGISPQLVDVLKENGISIPEEIIETRATEITVHGDWNSIRIPVPAGREMLTVFRGSSPRQRERRYTNLDSFLLDRAVEEGAQVLTAEVREVRRSASGRPVVSYRLATRESENEIEADFLAVAAGVNASPGMELRADPLLGSLARMMPKLRPPKLRKAAISEMLAEEDLLRSMEGEVHFAQYGSRDLPVEMSSLTPRSKVIEVVILGKSVDRADRTEYPEIVDRFMALPHIRRVLPRGAHLQTVCARHANMSVQAAKHYFSDGIALVGDAVVSRLHQDGLFSAYVTSSALADCILSTGGDRASLKKQYAPIVKRFDLDNRFGRVVFTLSRVVLSNPQLSRVVYQALITERETKRQPRRQLNSVLWKIASGDDSYRRIFGIMIRPASIWSIVVGGLLATVRNYLTERLFGLSWEGFGRYPTAVAVETVKSKRQEIWMYLLPSDRPRWEKMYSIKMRAGTQAILRQLGKFGDPDNEYFTPRFIQVRRTRGAPNVVGTSIRYHVTPSLLSLELVLEKFADNRYLLYRVVDGFARGGILNFDVDTVRPGVSLLTIYVGFNFPRGKSIFGRLGWRAARLIFPAFIHDVLWNHALCKMKDLAELDEDLGVSHSP